MNMYMVPNNNRRLHQIDSDLRSAVSYNGGLDLELVKGVVACVYGENDEAYWHWILKMKDGKYGYAVGGCDYTGWDCQSWFNFVPARTLNAAIMKAPNQESDWRTRKIRRVLRKQAEGTQPFGSIDGSDNA
jgi:hypothetical protein